MLDDEVPVRLARVSRRVCYDALDEVFDVAFRPRLTCRHCTVGDLLGKLGWRVRLFEIPENAGSRHFHLEVGLPTIRNQRWLGS